MTEQIQIQPEDVVNRLRRTERLLAFAVDVVGGTVRVPATALEHIDPGDLEVEPDGEVIWLEYPARTRPRPQKASAEREQTAKEHAVLQAQTWAQEARTQRSIVHELLELLGAKGRADYEAAGLLRERIATLRDVLTAGAKLATAAYNLAQGRTLDDNSRKSLAESQKAWDEAIRRWRSPGAAADVVAELERERDYLKEQIRRRKEAGGALGGDPNSDCSLVKLAEDAANPGAPFNLRAHLARQRAWSERTFGPGPRTQMVVDHIRKELREIEAAPDDLEEWIDVVMLSLDGAWRCGASPDEIIEQLVAKQAKNEQRKWPDWRTHDPDKAIEHVREDTDGTVAAVPTVVCGACDSTLYQETGGVVEPATFCTRCGTASALATQLGYCRRCIGELVAPEPVPMLMWCPECGERHVDQRGFVTRPHHTHACQGCGHTWRPAVVATVGVQFLPGFKDPVVPPISGPVVEDVGGE